MFLSRFSTNLQRKIDLTNAFKNFFRDDSFKLCRKISGFLGNRRLGCLRGARARVRPQPPAPSPPRDSGPVAPDEANARVLGRREPQVRPESTGPTRDSSPPRNRHRWTYLRGAPHALRFGGRGGGGPHRASW